MKEDQEENGKRGIISYQTRRNGNSSEEKKKEDSRNQIGVTSVKKKYTTQNNAQTKRRYTISLDLSLKLKTLMIQILNPYFPLMMIQSLQ